VKTVLLFGREPAAWTALATIIVQAVGAFWVSFSTDTQAWVVAAVAAGLNLAVAIVVRNGVIAAIGGLTQAVVSLAVGLGAHLTADQQFAVMALVTGLVQFAARQSVTAPTPPPDQSVLERMRLRRRPAPTPPAAPPAPPAAAA